MNESVVVVTGGGRGIGRAVCRRFGAEGAQVVAASRTTDELDETRRLVESAGGRCHVQPTDLCEPGEVEALMETTAGRFGRLDVLVNCAGVAPQAKIEELDGSLFEVILAVNVNAIYRACRAAWTIMKTQQQGVIVNVSSVASIDPFPGFAAYGASKAWVNAWTRGLAQEGRPFGIRVFSVAPGAVETRMLRNVFPDYPADQTLQPEDVADCVWWVSQPGCRYATGQTVFVGK